jgi:hypothetical protein
MKVKEVKHTFITLKFVCFKKKLRLVVSKNVFNKLGLTFFWIYGAHKKWDNLLRLMICYLSLKTQGDDENLLRV